MKESLDRTVIVDYPKVKIPKKIPEVPNKIYEERVNKIKENMVEQDFTHVIVYGDREHFANIRFLTGYDPRFEETLLIIPLEETPILLVGNEGLDYAKIAKGVDLVLYQHFSLQGQPRNQSKSLNQIFNEAGITNISKVGLVGYKYDENNVFKTIHYTDIPFYIVDILTDICGLDKVEDVTKWFTHPSNGYRIPATVDEIARYEVANLIVYSGMKNAIESLEVGITEVEVAEKLDYNGLFPLSCHIVVAFSDNTKLALPSPTYQKLKLGDPVSIAFGIWGANIARSGVAITEPSELPSHINDIHEKVFVPYFLMLHKWYKNIQVGVTGSEIYNSIKEYIEDPFLGIKLNPGHQLREEEWINSPFNSKSNDMLISGTILQCDINVPATLPYYGIHTEDGLVLADQYLRKEIKEKYPHVWQRIIKRRSFLINQLGYELHKDVLPLSDMQGFVTPYLLNPKLALCFKK